MLTNQTYSDNPRIYLTNLGKYNEGELLGEWVDLPVSDDFQKAFKDIGINNFYEEFFITDYENFHGFQVDEYSNLQELNDIAERLEALSEYDLAAIDAYLDGVDNDFDRAFEVVAKGDFTFYENCHDMSDVAYQYAEGTGLLNDIPESLQCYFDFEAFGRDLNIEGTFIYSPEISGYFEFFNY